MNLEIRKETPDDYFETEAMTRRSFYNVHGPGCDEHLLVHKLRTHKDFLPDCSRIALVDGKIAGVIMFFRCIIHGDDGDVTIASFGPLCVDHKYKNCGIGRRLLEATIPLVKEAGFPGIVIFGEPEYYPKIGFRRCREFGLTDMEGNASDPFMGLELIEGGLHIKGGRFEESSVVEECTEEALMELEKKFPPLKKISRPCQWSYDNAYDDKEGYHYEYATHFPEVFECMLKEFEKETDDDILKEIWRNFDKTPYVLFTGKEAFGIFVINNETEPVIEHLYLKKEKADADKIEAEVRERLKKANNLWKQDCKLRLRPYKPEDAKAIVGWIKDETALRKWSSDRYGAYPISPEDINHKYLDCNGDCVEPDNFYPFTAEDENGPIGHLILRYTNGEKTVIRLGFIIVDDTKRGMGYGKRMIQMAIKYAFDMLGAEKITLGVFENNPPAYYCYKAAGFSEIPMEEDFIFEILGEKWKCIEMDLKKDKL